MKLEQIGVCNHLCDVDIINIDLNAVKGVKTW